MSLNTHLLNINYVLGTILRMYLYVILPPEVLEELRLRTLQTSSL